MQCVDTGEVLIVWRGTCTYFTFHSFEVSVCVYKCYCQTMSGIIECVCVLCFHSGLEQSVGEESELSMLLSTPHTSIIRLSSPVRNPDQSLEEFDSLYQSAGQEIAGTVLNVLYKTISTCTTSCALSSYVHTARFFAV